MRFKLDGQFLSSASDLDIHFILSSTVPTYEFIPPRNNVVVLASKKSGLSEALDNFGRSIGGKCLATLYRRRGPQRILLTQQAPYLISKTGLSVS
jgi:hypothetical protein